MENLKHTSEDLIIDKKCEANKEWKFVQFYATIFGYRWNHLIKTIVKKFHRWRYYTNFTFAPIINWIADYTGTCNVTFGPV